jgi:hypothetical protein
MAMHLLHQSDFQIILKALSNFSQIIGVRLLSQGLPTEIDSDFGHRLKTFTKIRRSWPRDRRTRFHRLLFVNATADKLVPAALNAPGK